MGRRALMLETLNSIIKPGTRTAHLLTVNQKERACQKERETSLGIVNTVSFMGLSHFVSANSRNTNFFKKYVRIKIGEHKILVLMSKPMNSTIKNWNAYDDLPAQQAYQKHQQEREICLCLTHSLSRQVVTFQILQLSSVFGNNRSILLFFNLRNEIRNSVLVDFYAGGLCQKKNRPTAPRCKTAYQTPIF